MNKAIVLGVGPEDGLGGQLAVRFGAGRHHVFIAGRTQQSLDALSSVIEESGGHATAVVTDATDEQSVVNLFKTVDGEKGDLTLAIYNAGNNTPGRIIDMDADYFERSWRVLCFGGFVFGRETIRRMQGSGGTLLFTGASASMRGRPGFGAFNSGKSALRILAQAMAKEYGADGIHVGHVVVDGPIGGAKIRNAFPEYAEKLGDSGMISISGIVDAFDYLYRQPRNAWSFEVDVRTSIEEW
ncbi:MAG: SDR family NAD(P)-dependent oxidoreductase [Pseudomonadales bacterium]